MADRFVFPPGPPSPSPAPAAPLPPTPLAPQPATVARPAAGWTPSLVRVLLIVLALVVGYDIWLRWHAVTPSPTPVTNDPVAAGKAYGATLAKDWADAIDVAASVIEAKGATVADSQKSFQDAFDANRRAGFNQVVRPTWIEIFPEKEPITDANRAAYGKMLRATAKGARGQ